MNLTPPALQRRRLRLEAARVEAETARLHDLAASNFAASMAAVRAALRLGRDASGEIPTVTWALAHTAVVAAQTLGFSVRAEQLQAALAIYRGQVCWLPAGAGKSLALALAAVLHAWGGHPCRVATATVYLARRDSERLRPLFAGCGLSLRCVTEETSVSPEEPAPAADVIYAGARQLLVDGLREQVLRGAVDDPLRMRLRGLAGTGGGARAAFQVAVLVDDADLVLIDDAGSPLVISAPGDNPLLLEALIAARELVDQLRADEDYRYLATTRDIEFSAAGQARLEDLGERLPGIWHESERRDDLIRQAIAVRDLLQAGRHYRLEEGKVVILDDGIGRALGGRGWTYGLLQAIEARAGVAFTPPTRTLARMSYPAFLRRHAFRGGIGRGRPGADAVLHEGYGLASLRLEVPGPPPLIEIRTFTEREEKLDALAETAARLHADQQPVLIVTRRGGDSEALFRRLSGLSTPCELLDARTLSDATVAGLADPGRVFLAQSNVLHGVTLEASVREKLNVLLAEPHDLAHADQRVAALSSGRASLFMAPDDELLCIHLPRASAWSRRMNHSPVALRVLLRLAQSLAARGARKQGKLLARRDAMLNQQLAFTGEQDIDLGIYAFGNPGKD
ncbi:MAG: hypothetical protein Q8M09_14040 [Pseudomonadota bacterium]|nr:hypothetical protein [Pseudomonadota bacterium]MDP1905346.1 hypothetical protein [Pseudomonadota bacterium]MDP2353498.1 hypothetical protein [Pseudomonadota bacterium]